MDLSACPMLSRDPERGTWYRAIEPPHWTTALSTAHTKLAPSRFSPGALAPTPFEVLYLAENHQVTHFEVGALFGDPMAGAVVANPYGSWAILNIEVRLRNVADLTDEQNQQLLQTTAQELTGDWRGYSQRSMRHSVKGPVGIAPTQALGAALYAVDGLEGFRSISGKLPYYAILVVFPQKLQPGSRLEFTDPSSGKLYKIGPIPP